MHGSRRNFLLLRREVFLARAVRRRGRRPASSLRTRRRDSSIKYGFQTATIVYRRTEFMRLAILLIHDAFGFDFLPLFKLSFSAVGSAALGSDIEFD